jgi:hypothetical protein
LRGDKWKKRKREKRKNRERVMRDIWETDGKWKSFEVRSIGSEIM